VLALEAMAKPASITPDDKGAPPWKENRSNWGTRGSSTRWVTLWVGDCRSGSEEGWEGDFGVGAHYGPRHQGEEGHKAFKELGS